MPGKDSLKHNQYYAHPRNAFWPIIEETFGTAVKLPYDDRLNLLLQNNIGLWDVIRNCKRTTSLDSAIVEETIVVNDFEEFLAQHPLTTRILFNGIKAEQSFRRYAAKAIEGSSILYQRMPSTSPANARMTFQQKLEIWKNSLLPLS
jgi:hypoxanthine-DNA glycosylase